VSEVNKTRLREALLAWYDRHARQFFWREHHNKKAHPPDPYVVLVSEVMLQQTQTSRVQEKLPIFLQQFPTLQALADADNATIIKAWEGMGYNSRALRLRDCAKALLEGHHGMIPSTKHDLLALPGIGSYTASAIMAFAYHEDVAVLDVNIRRVYSRLLARMATTADVLEESVVEEFAESIYPHGQSSRWHQAVMDVGALFCTARAPKCSVCPLQALCASAEGMSEVRKEKRPEPSWNGTPNRIWRGRIVQILRGVEAEQTITVDEITTQLFPTMLFHNEEEQQTRWLRSVLAGLERDGIVEILTSDDNLGKNKRRGKATSNLDSSRIVLRLSSQR
jgi:A/G-specific adenine glycosylase